MNKSLLIIIGIIIIGAIAYMVLRSPENSSRQTVDETALPLEPIEEGNVFVQQAPEEDFVLDEDLLLQEDTANGGDTVAVSIDDAGFSEETITVLAGTTIVFTNNGQGLHQVASDPHPTHTNVPGLDSKKGLATGETFSFTFENAGTFTVHDHLAPSHKATIIVQ